ncbi:hypothetical protein FRB95_005895 [Tulasnella sp. JGI-2019a]|nr:hypothetical protein FRB95_005895 [Tulasnella sp. JGI-2019a]
MALVLRDVRLDKASPDDLLKAKKLQGDPNPAIMNAAGEAFGHRALLRFQDPPKSFAISTPEREDALKSVRILELTKSDPEGQGAAREFLTKRALKDLADNKSKAEDRSFARANEIRRSMSDGATMIAAHKALVDAIIDHVWWYGATAHPSAVNDLKLLAEYADPEIRFKARRAVETYESTVKAQDEELTDAEKGVREQLRRAGTVVYKDLKKKKQENKASTLANLGLDKNGDYIDIEMKFLLPTRLLDDP